MRAWKPRRMLPRASRSWARLVDFCHVCCHVSDSQHFGLRSQAYQYLIVALAEACQPLLRVVRGGLLLLLGRAAE